MDVWDLVGSGIGLRHQKPGDGSGEPPFAAVCCRRIADRPVDMVECAATHRVGTGDRRMATAVSRTMDLDGSRLPLDAGVWLGAVGTAADVVDAVARHRDSDSDLVGAGFGNEATYSSQNGTCEIHRQLRSNAGRIYENS